MGNDLIKKMRHILGAGTLGQKYHDINLIVAEGFSMLYSGDVTWQVKLPTQTMQGTAESVDAALEHLRLLFEDILRTMRPDTKVTLALKECAPPRD